MARALNNIKRLIGGGMDTDSAPEYIQGNDYIFAQNLRITGTEEKQSGYGSNIESTEAIIETTPIPSGINKIIGAKDFDELRKGVLFRYNSFGNHQILLYDYDTNTASAIYTDLTDSSNIPLMPLDPQYYVTAIMVINNKYLCWADGQSKVGFANLDKLQNASYSTVTAEDLSLIKPQPLPPITGYYDNDLGKASNFLKQKLFQFNTMWFGEEYTLSAWSTWSKRIIPNEEATPSVGDDVTQNNCIVLFVPIGSERVLTINVGARYNNFDFAIIKSVDRSYVLVLPDTAVDINQEILEAYDPATGLYSFVFYNDSISVPVATQETDHAYDHVPLIAGAGEVLNGSIIALGDCTEGYARPTTSVTIGAVGYDPNLTTPNSDTSDPMRITYIFPGESGSGAGNHRRIMKVGFQGTPAEDDEIIIVIQDIRDFSNTLTYSYTVPSSQAGDLFEVTSSLMTLLPDAYFTFDGITRVITFVGPPYYQLSRAFIILTPPGATVSKSIHSVLDNSSYQLALAYRDTYGRYFPLCTGNQYIVRTASLAQLEGLALKFSWTINTNTAPVNAVDYQWVITKNATAKKVLDVVCSPVDYKGTWNAHTNSPTLVINPGGIGDAYQVTEPNQSTDTTLNLGNGTFEYNTGDFILSNGRSWDIIERSFGDLSSTDTAWFFKLNPLALYNEDYAASGQSTVLNYEYTPGDKCVLHYSFDTSGSGTPTWLNAPCIELGILGYDPTTYLLKTTSSASIDYADILGKNIYMRLVNTAQSNIADTNFESQTVWYEIGERFTITNGIHDTLTGEITDGDVYYKTRTYRGGLDPEHSYPVFAVDFNFSDFYESAFTSYGRPRTFYDELEASERKAIIRYSQNYILGSRNNGLTRFYATAIYGEAERQTSSSWGAIGAMWMRGNILVVIQASNTAYVPVNLSMLEDGTGRTLLANSDKFLNDIRYNQTGNIGIGRAKESFCFYNNTAWFVDPNNAIVIQIGLDGMTDITYRMSKYLKAKIAEVYGLGRKIVMYYDRFYKEVVLAFQTEGGVLTQIPFTDLSWRVLENYTVAPGDITPANGSNSTVSYNSGTGIATYTPTSSTYVGNDVSVISFDVDGVPTTKNVCLEWTAGTEDVSGFSLIAIIGQPVSTVVYSNYVLVNGNTIPAPISIVDGEYSVNGGAFTSSAGTVNSGDSVQVRQTTSASVNTETVATLTIDGQSAGFSATTVAAAPDVTVAATISKSGIQLTIDTDIPIDCPISYNITWNVTDLHGNNTFRGETVTIPPSGTTVTTSDGNSGDTILCVDVGYAIYYPSCGSSGSVSVLFYISGDLSYCASPE